MGVATSTVAGYWFDAPAGDSTDLAVLLMRALAEEGDAVSLHDASDAVAAVTSVKELREIKNIKSSASITDVVFKKFFVPKLEDYIEESRNDMSAATLGATLDTYYKQPSKISNKLSADVRNLVTIKREPPCRSPVAKPIGWPKPRG